VTLWDHWVTRARQAANQGHVLLIGLLEQLTYGLAINTEAAQTIGQDLTNGMLMHSLQK